jgi:preprotein translocase subunit SecB
MTDNRSSSAAANGEDAAAANGDGAEGGQGATAQATGPRLSILTQYVKDLSFENPRAPLGLQPGQPRPEIQIQVDVQARQLGEEQFEVVLDLNAEARAGESVVFLTELSYGGVFSIANIPADSLQPLLLIECPRLLFPFARRIIADATRDGGFPPLMVDPIDFVALYRRRLQAAQEGGAPGGEETGTA